MEQSQLVCVSEVGGREPTLRLGKTQTGFSCSQGTASFLPGVGALLGVPPCNSRSQEAQET